jgi:hypothetical protein
MNENFLCHHTACHKPRTLTRMKARTCRCGGAWMNGRCPVHADRQRQLSHAQTGKYRKRGKASALRVDLQILHCLFAPPYIVRTGRR